MKKGNKYQSICLNELMNFLKNNKIKNPEPCGNETKLVEFANNTFLTMSYMHQVNNLIGNIERKAKKQGISVGHENKKFSERISYDIIKKLNDEQQTTNSNEDNALKKELKNAEEKISQFCEYINEYEPKDKSYIVIVINSLYLSESEIQFDDDILLFYDCYLKLKPLIDRHLKSKNLTDEDSKKIKKEFLDKCDWIEIAEALNVLNLFSEENIYQTISYIKEETMQYKPCDQKSIKICQKIVLKPTE